MLTALAIGYPFVCHLGLSVDATIMPLLWLALLFGLGFVLNPRAPVFLLFALLTVAAAGWGFAAGRDEELLRVPPVLIALALGVVFARTLLPGRTPLIARIAERARGNLPGPVADYSRVLTWVWTWFFFAMALECMLLGLYAPPFLWSLTTNFINYVLIALLFVLEYPIRRRVLRDFEHASFVDSLRVTLRQGLH